MALTVLCLCVVAYAVRMRMRAAAASNRAHAEQCRSSSVLEAVRIVTAASRESSTAVLTALDRTLRILEPCIDAILVFTPEGDTLRCAYAGGIRAERFNGTSLARADSSLLVCRAAQCGHHLNLDDAGRALIPTDRAALAMPMHDGQTLVGVVYAASLRSGSFAQQEMLLQTVRQAAVPFAVAFEREADRTEATFDALTGLYTPRAFRARLQDDVAIARMRGDGALALWFVDTDRFKMVNDTRGHAAGDAVLRQMAALLREHLSAATDVPARNGGDEFCAILHNSQKIVAVERARRFCDAVRLFDFGVGCAITASIGVAAFPYDAQEASDLLEAADAAMYHSKRTGRDRVSFPTAPSVFAVHG